MTSTPLHPARLSVHAAIFAGLAIFVTSPLLAQTSVGLIGARTLEVGVFHENIREAGIDDGLGVTARVNIPLLPAIDLAISGAQEDIDTNDFRERTAFATIVAHWNAKDFTPYVTGSVGNVWQSVVVEGEKISGDEAIFGVGAGVEAPIGDRTALDVRVTYYKYSAGDLGHYWIYGASINHWFTDRVGATIGVNFRESDSTIFTVGAALRF